ncbi:response regulator [Arsenicibacter rosenii]|uniref:response regulator n=1 Tax=Arsenicibacter rosenii TaxID=1750698 RepID=UPI0015A556BA|nr:response regulator [Arsenicibacter rosenii]
MLIDDEPVFLDIINRVTREHFPGVSFISCKNGNEAVAYLTQKENVRPRLILLDLFLSPMEPSGLTLLIEIKKQLADFQLPIVVISSYSEESLVQKAYDLGASSFIEKPTNLRGWKTMVKNMLDYWKDNNIPEVKPANEQTPSVVPKTPPYK